MKDSTIYRIEVDGEIAAVDFKSFEDAMEGIHNYFFNDQNAKEARIIKCTFKDLGVIVFNNKKQEL
jgi:hypothetical protein